MIKIQAAIVTYGTEKRWHGLKESLKGLNDNEDIDSITVVDNGTSYDLKSKINDANFEKQVNVIRSNTNLGSAYGFKKAIQSFDFSNTAASWLLLLDDDTKIDEETFIDVQQLEKRFEGRKHIWSLYRTSRYPDMFVRDWDWNINAFKNRFVGVSVAEKLNKKKTRNKRIYSDTASLMYAPYSGMLIPASVLKIGIEPDERFYLYDDDIDYSFKVKKNDVDILSNRNFVLNDLEQSWSASFNHGLTAYFGSEVPVGRYLYHVRNSVYMINSMGLKTSKLQYMINKSLFIIIAFILAFKNRKINRFQMLVSAILDGENGTLGFNKDYKL